MKFFVEKYALRYEKVEAQKLTFWSLEVMM